MSGLSREITEITDPLLKIGPALARDMIGTTINRILAEAGPRQAEVLRRCAIPRWFDLDVLGELREKAEGNDRIMELLRGYSFVRQLDANRFAYHDEVRETLLAEWHAQRAEELRQINERLAAYFRERAAKAMPTRTVPKGPRTTVYVTSSGEWDLYEREALYHTLAAEPITGMVALGEAFDQAEAAHRLGDAEALLQITRNMPLDANAKLWLQFMRARLAKAGLQLDAAEQQFTALLATPNIDGLLEARARQSLGEVYAETARWVQATKLYRKARATFEALNRQHDVAEIWRLLGEAYQALGTSTGGWHVPAYPRNRFWHMLGQLWSWLLSLPFFVTSIFLRGSGLMPRPRYLSSYRNWTLTWLYRTAAACYTRSRNVFEQLGDDTGMLQTERQLADIVRLFGYPKEALQRVEHIKTRPAAADFYRRSWVDLVAAQALIDLREVERARPLIDSLLARLRGTGDLRLEAAVLNLNARAAAAVGNFDQALALYSACLERFRTLRYSAARESVLYDLRSLRRMVGPGERSQRIRAMLAAEPEKQYVARFPQSQLPMLRILSVVALPLALLLLAVVGPRDSIAQVAQLVSLQTTVDPARMVVLLAILLVIYAAVYALVATAVIAFVPLGNLDREQPDYFVTSPEGIARYDYRGTSAQQFEWGDIGRWLRIERRLWALPVSLLSGAYLESRAGEDMEIGASTGWYLSLQEDIDMHLREHGSSVQSENFGFTVIRSRLGMLAALGLVLLALFLWSQNSTMYWLIELLPPYVYAALALLAFSGLLILIPIAYWLAINPLALRRTLGIRDYYPFAVAVVGIGLIATGVMGLAPRVPSLNFGLVITGALILGYALAVIVAASNRALQAIVATLALLAGLAYAGRNAVPAFDLLVNRVGADRALNSAGAVQIESAETSISAAGRIATDPNASEAAKAQALTNTGRSYYALGDYAAAVRVYTQALEIYSTLPEGEYRTQAVAVVLYNRYKALVQTNTEGWSSDLSMSCTLVSGIGPDCPQ